MQDQVRDAGAGDIAVQGFMRLGLTGASWSIFQPDAGQTMELEQAPGITRAYHLLSTSLESLIHRPSPPQAFASALRNALSAYVAMAHYRRLGHAANDQRGLHKSSLLTAIHEAAANDLNPIGRCFLAATSLTGVLSLHRSIHELTAPTLKTEFAIQDGVMVMMRRLQELGVHERHADLAPVDMVVSRLPSSTGSESANRVSAAIGVLAGIKVSDIAERLGLRLSAANDVAMAFESEPGLQLRGLAQYLGCHQRTLQREMQAAGVTTGHIRRAAMLNNATAPLPSPLTLTEIAHRTGYADQAHMTRAFALACGLPPSQLRKAFR